MNIFNYFFGQAEAKKEKTTAKYIDKLHGELNELNGILVNIDQDDVIELATIKSRIKIIKKRIDDYYCNVKSLSRYYLDSDNINHEEFERLSLKRMCRSFEDPTDDLKEDLSEQLHEIIRNIIKNDLEKYKKISKLDYHELSYSDRLKYQKMLDKYMHIIKQYWRDL